MKLIWTIIILIMLFCIYQIQTGYTEAMEMCLQKHSYDTCAYNLR